jgi:farnesyl diphosphate synthase
MRLDLEERLERWRTRVERELDACLPPDTRSPGRLHAAQRYSVLAPGKRVRPALVYATAETLGVPLERVDAVACAVELIHAYSLIHDDLPAMDDDDLRRGRPTCHRAFDEATAILAGDALQALAFAVLVHHPRGPEPAVRVQLVATLADASGTGGMAGGQALDLAAEGRNPGLAELEGIHALKTGALIRASVRMAALCAPGQDAAGLESLDRFAAAIGLAFQVQDDILDVEGDPSLIGKPVGSDQARGLPTYAALAGLDEARRRVVELNDAAMAALAEHGWDHGPLAGLATWLLGRRH